MKVLIESLATALADHARHCDTLAKLESQLADKRAARDEILRTSQPEDEQALADIAALGEQIVLLTYQRDRAQCAVEAASALCAGRAYGLRREFSKALAALRQRHFSALASKVAPFLPDVRPRKIEEALRPLCDLSPIFQEVGRAGAAFAGQRFNVAEQTGAQFGAAILKLHQRYASLLENK
jgi:hypothetical protein